MALQNNPNLGTAVRYLGSNLTGGLTVFVALGTLSPDQAQDVLKNVHVMYEATRSFVGAFANIWYIVFPIAAVWLARIGINTNGFGGFMDRLLKVAQSGNTPEAAQAQKQLVDATTTMLNTTAPQVATTQVKAAILNAAVTLPEVADAKIEVADKALAEAAPSPSVIASPTAR